MLVTYTAFGSQYLHFENSIYHSFLLLSIHSYLNGFGPLQIGGVENSISDMKINFTGFSGCISKYLQQW